MLNPKDRESEKTAIRNPVRNKESADNGRVMIGSKNIMDGGNTPKWFQNWDIIESTRAEMTLQK